MLKGVRQMIHNKKNTVYRKINPGQITVFLLTIGVFIFLSLARKYFFTYSNVYSLIFGLSMEFLAIIGFTFLLIMGEIDLSVGSVYGFTGAFSGFLVLSGLPIWLGIIIALTVAGIIGFVNGYFVTRFRVNSLMMTLGMMILVRGVLDFFVRHLGGISYPRAFKAVVRFKIGDVNLTIFIMIVIVIILEFLLRKHTAFRKLYYIGENIKSAKLYGIKAERIKLIFFVCSSVTAAMAGIFAASRSGSTVFNTGLGLEFKMVTAAVIGGASLFGGKGSILKSVTGLLFLAIIMNGMIMFNIDPEWQSVVIGLILISAVIVDTRINREKSEY